MTWRDMLGSDGDTARQAGVAGCFMLASCSVAAASAHMHTPTTTPTTVRLLQRRPHVHHARSPAASNCSQGPAFDSHPLQLT